GDQKPAGAADQKKAEQAPVPHVRDEEKKGRADPDDRKPAEKKTEAEKGEKADGTPKGPPGIRGGGPGSRKGRGGPPPGQAAPPPPEGGPNPARVTIPQPLT